RIDAEPGGRGDVATGEGQLGGEHRRRSDPPREQLRRLGDPAGARRQLDLHGAQRWIRSRTDRDDQRLDLAGRAAAGGYLTLAGKVLDGQREVTGSQIVQDDLAQAIDRIERAQGAVVAGLPGQALAAREARAAAVAGDELGGAALELDALVGGELREDVVAHDVVHR